MQLEKKEKNQCDTLMKLIRNSLVWQMRALEHNLHWDCDTFPLFSVMWNIIRYRFIIVLYSNCLVRHYCICNKYSYFCDGNMTCVWAVVFQIWIFRFMCNTWEPRANVIILPGWARVRMNGWISATLNPATESNMDSTQKDTHTDTTQKRKKKKSVFLWKRIPYSIHPWKNINYFAVHSFK